MFDSEIKEVYNEDTVGRKYHTPVVSKRKRDMERVEENGEVSSLSLSEPMSRSQFESLPNSLKVVYIKHLRSVYSASMIQMASMLCIPYISFRKWMDRLELRGIFSKGKNLQTKKQAKEWEKFLSLKVTSEDNIKPILKTEEKMVDTTQQTNNLSLKVSDCVFSLTGELNAQDIARKISAMVDDGVFCNVKIQIEAGTTQSNIKE
jgi:hypothetical protein